MVGDGVGHLRVVRQPLHALDGAGQDLLALQGLHQVQQVAAQLVRIRLNRALSVNGNHALAAPARHSEPAFGLPGVSLGGGRSRLARSLIIWHFRASLGNSGRLAQARRFCAGFQVSLGRLAAFRFLIHLSLGSVGVQRRAVRQFQVGRGRSARLTARYQAGTVGTSSSGLVRSLAAEQRILIFQFLFRTCHDLFPPFS